MTTAQARKTVRAYTTDRILDTLQWIANRQRYRRACGMVNGTAYSEECAMEAAAIAELEERGAYI